MNQNKYCASCKKILFSVNRIDSNYECRHCNLNLHYQNNELTFYVIKQKEFVIHGWNKNDVIETRIWIGDGKYITDYVEPNIEIWNQVIKDFSEVNLDYSESKKFLFSTFNRYLSLKEFL
jgi:hypothetical protein